ncbi:hypothetical protein GCM10009744_49900 [Kribbella alba]|uniref:Bacterial toxin 50 domain-containing protein n=1 Tax=Kribbella alba TaxID=190197 RepID=A0ABN2FMH7_9ACTN
MDPDSQMTGYPSSSAAAAASREWGLLVRPVEIPNGPSASFVTSASLGSPAKPEPGGGPEEADSRPWPEIPYTLGWFPAWRYLAQLPQGRKAARVSELFRVRGESSCPDPDGPPKHGSRVARLHIGGADSARPVGGFRHPDGHHLIPLQEK